MKAYRIIHTAANIIAFGLLGGFLVYFLLSYGGLPERIGVHFSAADGQLDVYSYKIFGFYPFVMGFGLLGAFSALTLPVNRIKKTGLKVNEKGGRVFRCTAALLLDLMKLTWSVFFSYWTYCVVHQTGMGDGTPLDAFRVFFIFILLSVPVLFSRIHYKYSTNTAAATAEDDGEEAPEPSGSFRVGHIIANVLSFASLGVFLVRFLLSYGELPERIGVHFGGDGTFDVYSYKVFGFYPFAAGFGLLIIFSLLDLAAKKIKHIGMNVNRTGDMKIRMIVIEALDLMKLTWSVFFSYWAYCVITQTAMPVTFTGIITTAFLLIFPLTAVMIVITGKRHRKSDNKNTEPTGDQNDNTSGN